MANSGIVWIDIIFNWSVSALYVVAGWVGITYQEINVLIFCIGWPLVTVIMMATILKLWRKNQVLSRRMAKGWFAH